MLLNIMHSALPLRALALLSLESRTPGFEFSSPLLTGQAGKIIQFASLGLIVLIHLPRPFTKK